MRERGDRDATHLKIYLAVVKHQTMFIYMCDGRKLSWVRINLLGCWSKQARNWIILRGGAGIFIIGRMR